MHCRPSQEGRGLKLEDAQHRLAAPLRRPSQEGRGLKCIQPIECTLFHRKACVIMNLVVCTYAEKWRAIFHVE